MILDELEDLRRTAYVRAVMSESVVGWIGSRVPVEVFDAMELTAFPVYGIDREILKYSSRKNMCPVVDATITYAETDKCPLIHSSKLIVLDDTCRAMIAGLSGLQGKRIYVYDGSSRQELIAILGEVYGTSDPAHEKLTAVLAERERIRTKILALTDGDVQVFILEYYMNFLGLYERMSFLDDLQDKDICVSHEFMETIYRCPECT